MTGKIEFSTRQCLFQSILCAISFLRSNKLAISYSSTMRRERRSRAWSSTRSSTILWTIMSSVAGPYAKSRAVDQAVAEPAPPSRF